MALVDDTPVPEEPGRRRPVPATRSRSGLTDAEFTSAVEAVTSAFGDPTRRGIYLAVRERAEGVTASEIAEQFALHANVARHHLDKLTAGGYVEVFVTRPARNGAGRPSKRYRVSAQAPGVEPPRRTDDLLVLLLGQALSLVPPDQAEAMAERVGEDYGRSMAVRVGPLTGGGGDGRGGDRTGGDGPSFRQALHTIADALSAHGFAAHAEARPGALALIQDRCPFFDTARQHPVICAVDRGMVRGMLSGLYGQPVPASLASSRARGDEACVTVTAL